VVGLIASAAPDGEDRLVGSSPSSSQLATLEAAAADALEGGSGDVVEGGLFAIAHRLPGSDGTPIGAIAVARPNEFDRPSRDVLRYLVGQATVSMENLALHEAVAEQAVTDALTGIANKRRFDEWLGLEAERAKRFGHSLSLLIFDVDDFKQVNDTRGHPTGDEVLRAIGNGIGASAREVDLPARYGGEEFVVGLTETDAEGARLAAERIRELVAGLSITDPGGGPALNVTVSVGVATLPEDAADAESLFAAADGALYAAKHAGKNCVRAAGS
jgi:diguanylate cyclase (GGDEF)-like protein